MTTCLRSFWAPTELLLRRARLGLERLWRVPVVAARGCHMIFADPYVPMGRDPLRLRGPRNLIPRPCGARKLARHLWEEAPAMPPPAVSHPCLTQVGALPSGSG